MKWIILTLLGLFILPPVIVGWGVIIGVFLPDITLVALLYSLFGKGKK